MMDAEAMVIGVEETAQAAMAAMRGAEPVAAAVLVDAPVADRDDAATVGRRMLVWAAQAAGSLGDPKLDERVVELARRSLAAPGAAFGQEIELAGVRYTVYLEVHGAPPELVIVGAGHIARPLCQLGALLGFRVVVLDDRPEFATRERFPEAARLVQADFSDPFRDVPLGPGSHLVLVTRGHKFDFDALRYALRLPEELAYVGMVGSRRRVRAALLELAAEGIPHERLRRVHAPIGLDIGAETPEEIAVAIAAEMIRLRCGGTGASLRDRARVVERWMGKGDDEL
jgi:xanthine dehydrogenase accessory factor